MKQIYFCKGHQQKNRMMFLYIIYPVQVLYQYIMQDTLHSQNTQMSVVFKNDLMKCVREQCFGPKHSLNQHQYHTRPSVNAGCVSSCFFRESFSSQRSPFSAASRSLSLLRFSITYSTTQTTEQLSDLSRAQCK